MMDHMAERHKSDDRQEPPDAIRDRGESGQSDYYYDDSTNYEIYRDESDDPEEDDGDS
jgi:hypothetical protein